MDCTLLMGFFTVFEAFAHGVPFSQLSPEWGTNGSVFANTLAVKVISSYHHV